MPAKSDLADRPFDRHILIVEDSATQAAQLQHLLEQAGYDVTTAGDGRQAMEAVHQKRPDIILSDIVMPIMDGYALCDLVKSDPELRDVPFILLTSLTDPHDIIRGLQCGADNFITKPYDTRYLLSRVQYTLANHDLRRRGKVDLGLEIMFGGRRYFISSERTQILDLLLSSYETAVDRQVELVQAQAELQTLNSQLEDKVRARTADLTAEIAERKRAEESLRQSEKRYRELIETAHDIIFTVDVDGIITSLNPAFEAVTGWPCADWIGKPFNALVHPADLANSAGQFHKLVEEAEAAATETRILSKQGSYVIVETRASRLSNDQSNIAGILGIARDVTARKQAEAQAQRQLRRISALRRIDMAIISSLDLRVTLNIILDQVTAQLGVDAADVLLLNSHSQTLEFTAGRGFRTAALQHTRLQVGDGLAGKAALERRIVNALQPGTADSFKRAPLLAAEGFFTYYAVPLISKGQVKGVLEIFHRAVVDDDDDWLGFLEMLAGQAAIAIDNALLLTALERSNTELGLAYDTTLEEWARALDLRDMRPANYSAQIADITVRLARELGMKDEQLVHVRRGALLHDAGKTGTPEEILRKAGDLAEAEWRIVRQQPVTAYELLSHIAFLRPALDIPYCHHERWDGAGYPRGLKGPQIPLAARIFAAVEVWEVMQIERPYRPARSPAEAHAYLRENAGRHFDPQVVEALFRILEANDERAAPEPREA